MAADQELGFQLSGFAVQILRHKVTKPYIEAIYYGWAFDAWPRSPIWARIWKRFHGGT